MLGILLLFFQDQTAKSRGMDGRLHPDTPDTRLSSLQLRMAAKGQKAPDGAFIEVPFRGGRNRPSILLKRIQQRLEKASQEFR